VSEATAALAALRRAAFLGSFTEEALQRLSLAGSPVDLAAGAILFQTGDPGEAAFVVLSGELEVHSQAPDGREVRLYSLQAGAVAGEMAAIDGEPRSAAVCAARNSRLWRIPRAALVDALEHDPRAAMALVIELSRRLRAANRALETERLLDLGGRLAGLLLSERPNGGLVALTQTEIARRLGLSREKVNRKLNAWAGEGVVEVSRSGVRVCDVRRLASLATPGAAGR